MCGIAGYFRSDEHPVDRRIVLAMRERLVHRGPDASGIFVDRQVGLGFRRLSIIDLSDRGNQPMFSAGGECVVIFNGEIFNFPELRSKLAKQGHVFKTGTDTEVLLASYLEHGIECVRTFNGMWAFALWDFRTRRLFCSRDRFGVKPFYYSWDGKTFVFASEIKAVLAHPSVPAVENRVKVFEYLAFGQSDRDSATMVAGVHQMPPGFSLLVSERSCVAKSHWVAPEAQLRIGWEEAVSHYRELLVDAVRIRLRSDVPVGLMLSGGQDSSAIAGIVASLVSGGQLGRRETLKTSRLKAFSVCFQDAGLDEREYIDAVVRAQDCEPQHLYPDGEEIASVFGDVLYANDEPLPSTSALAHALLLDRVSRSGVKVLLSGQGADEILGGYDRHIAGPLLHDHLMAGDLRGALRHLRGLKLKAGLGYRYMMLQAMRCFVPGGWSRGLKAVLWDRTGSWLQPEAWRSYSSHLADAGDRPALEAQLRRSLRDNLTRDTLPRIVHYEDRGSMMHSVEERFPFLDFRLVEFSLGLPVGFLVEEGLTKRILRDAAAGVLPEKIRLRTSKLGFATPAAAWTSRIARTPRMQHLLKADDCWAFSPGMVRRLLKPDARPQDSQALWRVCNYLEWRDRCLASGRQAL